MSKPTVILFTVLLLAMMPGLRAQESTALVKTPPQGTMWTVRIEPTGPATGKSPAPAPSTPSTPPQKPAGQPTSLVVRSGTNGVTQGEITLDTGRHDTYYVANDMLLLLTQNTGQAFVRPVHLEDGDPYSLRTAGYPGLAWLTPSTFKGEEKKNGIPCRHYATTIPQIELPVEAWIRSDSGYPLEAIVGERTYYFSPPTPFDQEIPLPDNCRNALARLHQEQSALEALRRANQAQK